MIFNLAEQLFGSDILLKAEQLEDDFLLGMGEDLLEQRKADFGYAVVNNLNVELLVDHDVFGLNRFKLTLMSLCKRLHS